MELYKELAEKCKIEENSHVGIPDEALKFFVRLILINRNNEQTPSFIQLGYNSGLFDGTGSVDFNSVQKYYEAINKKIKEIEQSTERPDLSHVFGVNFEYTQKNENIKKNKL